MDLEKKKQIAVKAQQLLAKGKFPEDILIDIKESRLRKEINKLIFSDPNKKPLSELSKEEKNYRTARLKVRHSFSDYVSILIMFRNVAYLALILGIIMLGTAITGLNPNHAQGILSLLAGIPILVISYSRQTIKDKSLIIALVFALAVVLEFAIYQLPYPIVYPLNEELLAVRYMAVLIFLNHVSPVAYVSIKITLAGILFYVHARQKEYLQLKEEFESMRVV